MKSKDFNKQDSMFFRAVAILMVVIAHYSNLIYAESGYKIWNLLNKLGRYGVALFFLVSGYGLAKSTKERELDYHFLLRRIQTVYFPFICMQLLALVFIGIPHNEMTVKDWIFYFAGIDYWYIIVILSLYFLFYITMRYIKQYQQTALFILVTGLNILFAFMGCEEWWYLTNYVFCMGVYFAFQDKNKQKRVELYTLFCFVGFVFASILYPNLEGVMVVHDFFKITAALCFAGFIWFAYAVFPFHINLKPIVKTGECSLYIYVLHVQILTFLRVHNLNSYAAIFLSLIVIIIISFLLKKIITKIITIINT